MRGPETLYGIFHKGSKEYDLYIWSGPYEDVQGAMGADLRSMKRAHSLGVFESVKEAQEVAEVFHSKWNSAIPPMEIVQPLQHGWEHHFAEWPNRDIEPAPAGVYTIWEGNRFIYVGMAGRTLGIDPENVPTDETPVTKPKNPLFSRLGAHANGRRSGDQFCVYVCDRFVVPSLDREQQRLIAEGSLKLDALTREFVQRNYSYRYITKLGGYRAIQLERLVQRGALDAGRPYLNPR